MTPEWVDLCTREGTLDPRARGWSRAPRVRANLGGPFLRQKRWDYWCVASDTCVLAITVADYREHLRVRSPRWRTVDVPGDRFAAAARPFSHWVSLTGG